jgi:hypothetical protein
VATSHFEVEAYGERGGLRLKCSLRCYEFVGVKQRQRNGSQTEVPECAAVCLPCLPVWFASLIRTFGSLITEPGSDPQGHLCFTLPYSFLFISDCRRSNFLLVFIPLNIYFMFKMLLINSTYFHRVYNNVSKFIEPSP